MTRLATAPLPPGPPPGRARARAALLGLAALAAASSSGVPPAAAAGAAVQGGGNPAIACRCRANGHGYELGERACLRTPAGYRLAECRMVQNVTSWSVLAGAAGEVCGVVSRLASPPGTAAAGAGGG